MKAPCGLGLLTKDPDFTMSKTHMLYRISRGEKSAKTENTNWIFARGGEINLVHTRMGPDVNNKVPLI